MEHRATDRIEGPNLVLRLVQPDDAAYLHALRINPAYNRYLSPVSGTADDQRRWIESYKQREARGEEFYYIVQRPDGLPCGTVRLYGIAGNRFTWGSWILDHNKPHKAALESALLSFWAGFGPLGLEEAAIDVRRDNTHAEAFYRRFGMTETGGTEQEIFFTYPRARFEADRQRHLSALGEIPAPHSGDGRHDNFFTLPAKGGR